MNDSITIKNKYSDKSLTARNVGTDESKFEMRNSSEMLITAILVTPADAHRLAEWITENIPKPPTGREKFDALPLGGLFTLCGDRLTRIKTGERNYVGAGEGCVYETGIQPSAAWDTFEEVTA